MISRTIIFLHSFTTNFCYGGLNSVKLSLQKVITEMFIVSISVLKNLVEKNDISGFIWYVHSNDKMLFFQPKIIYSALLSLNCFFLKERFVFYIHASASRLQDVYRKKRSKDLLKKLYIPLYLTQTVHSNGKMLFF